MHYIFSYIRLTCHFLIKNINEKIMKKKLRLVLFGSVLLSVGAYAQPTLTSSGINPVVGDQINNVSGSYVSPGNSGAAQTWDLSTMTTGTPAPTTFITPSSTPYAASFPTANVGYTVSNSYLFYKTSSTAWKNAGSVSSNNVILAYTDMEDLLRFPFNFNDTYTDPWATTFTNGGATFYRTGNTTVTADSYGTLITPSGTYSNVLRVHFVEDYQDSADVGGFPYIITYYNDEYMWYLNGNHNPVAVVYDLAVNGSSALQTGFYMTGVMAVPENTALISYALFPNPVTDNLNVNISVRENKNALVSLYNSLGAQVQAPLSAKAHAGDNNYTINVQNLPAGIYTAEVRLDGQPASSRMFTVTR
jgi:hypothetical protein